MVATTIRLDVGGTIYRVSKSLLEQTHSGSMLARLVSDTWHNNSNNPTNIGDNDDPIFIDRNGDRFQHVLDYLRDPETTFPPHLAAAIGRELDYFGIPYDAADKRKQLPLPNLQPGLRGRVIRAGAWVFQAMGQRALFEGTGSKFQQPGAILQCRFNCVRRTYSDDPLEKDGTIASRGLELCAIAHLLSAEQLSEVWIPEYGIQCCSVEPNASNTCIFFNVTAIAFAVVEEEPEP